VPLDHEEVFHRLGAHREGETCSNSFDIKEMIPEMISHCSHLSFFFLTHLHLIHLVHFFVASFFPSDFKECLGSIFIANSKIQKLNPVMVCTQRAIESICWAGKIPHCLWSNNLISLHFLFPFVFEYSSFFVCLSLNFFFFIFFFS